MKTLGGKLLGYVRLRVLSYRIIFLRVQLSGGEHILHCVFAGHRDTVHAAFEQVLRQQNGQKPAE